MIAADSRDLADYAAHPPVQRPDHQDVSATVAGAPDPEAIRVELRQGPGEADGVPVVADLRPGVNLAAGLPVGGAEVPMVEHDHPEAGGSEHLGVRVEVHLLHCGEAVRHHNARHTTGGLFRQKEPATQARSFGIEFDIPSHRSLLSFPNTHIARSCEVPILGDHAATRSTW